ncbi:tetratricopeptide repeat protein [Pseudotabrizicola sediminis]|nr:tetratricopeptide repeat protein [Pseudotabrizicola sediminis]
MFRSSSSTLVFSVILSAIAATAPAIAETRAGSAVAVVAEAESDLARRADASDLRAQLSLARMLAQDNRFGLSVQHWQLAEAQGHPRARYQLAGALMRVEGVAADPVEGVRLLRLGAEAGHISSIASLARALETGLGAEPDLSEAVRLYEIAAADGHAYARFRRALALSDKPSPATDPTRGATLLFDLVEEGYRPAFFAMAESLMMGRPLDSQRERARDLRRAEALAGNDQALARLAWAYPNDYIMIVQAALCDTGHSGGQINGSLTARTIGAITRFCLETGINDVCRHGPMRSDAARSNGRNLFLTT